MVLRLSYYRFFIRLCCYPLPFFAFVAGAYVRFLSDKIGLSPFAYDLPFYAMLLAFTTLVWIIAVEHYQLCSIEEFFREYTGLKKAAAACLATCTLQLCALFFYRGYDLSRIFFIATAVALFAGTVLIRTLFRLLLWSEDRHRSPLSVLIVGSDAYAGHTSQPSWHVYPFCPCSDHRSCSFARANCGCR